MLMSSSENISLLIKLKKEKKLKALFCKLLFHIAGVVIDVQNLSND
jgi:hypothetical protein